MRKNKINLLIIILIITCGNKMLAQSKPKEKKEKFLRHQISVDGGFHYSNVFNAKRVVAEPEPCKECNFNVSFMPLSTTSYHFGEAYNYFLNKSFKFHTGLIFSKHNFLNEGIIDSVLKYNISYYKIFGSKNNFEVPLMLGYIAKNLTALVGVHYIFMQSYSYKQYYIDGTFFSFKKPFMTNEFKPRYYWTVQFNYKLSINKKIAYPYLCILRIENNIYDFQIGLILPIFKKMQTS